MRVSWFCPRCGARLEAEGVRGPGADAVCGRCEYRFDIARRLSPSERPAIPAAPLVPVPARMRTTRQGGDLTVRWRWYEPSYWAMLVFCIAWDSFLVFWYTNATGPGAPWIAIVFPVGHVAIGAWITYSVVAGFLNSTTVHVSRRDLSVRHGPVPWRGGRRTVPVRLVRQLFCEDVTSNRRGRSGRADSAYQLCALTTDGRRIPLLALPRLADARYLEQTIESHLSIPPEPVVGECG